jgi:hypothetical protein
LNAARHLDSFLQARRNKRNRKNACTGLKNQYAGGGTAGQGELHACAPVMLTPCFRRECSAFILSAG